MALFSNKEAKETTNEASTVSSSPSQEDLSWVLVGPRVTEKSAFISGDNAYVFDVSPRANKVQVKKAITATYKVSPRKVNIVNQESRSEVRRGRKVHVKGTKKAVIFLKKGDSIELA